MTDRSTSAVRGARMPRQRFNSSFGMTDRSTCAAGAAELLVHCFNSSFGMTDRSTDNGQQWRRRQHVSIPRSE